MCRWTVEMGRRVWQEREDSVCPPPIVRVSRIVAVLLTTVRPGSLELPAMLTNRQLQVRRLVAEESPYGFAVRTWDHSPPPGQRRYEAQPALRTTNYAGMEVSDCDAQSGRI